MVCSFGRCGSARRRADRIRGFGPKPGAPRRPRVNQRLWRDPPRETVAAATFAGGINPRIKESPEERSLGRGPGAAQGWPWSVGTAEDGRGWS
ncbi:hypothetical protein HMPREF9440_00484 [Sutterella parvirubra YIT 11816]|uniref:Uncharacterized protein n=1 Tax=Sutterella parvirubra YIT 11816 TaxID=762967 RepID=H3KCN1_9BURK|nr:hypothetical protein HMPREF9440_00484 [Sutterella parvirubra YIT 11816]